MRIAEPRQGQVCGFHLRVLLQDESKRTKHDGSQDAAEGLCFSFRALLKIIFDVTVKCQFFMTHIFD